MLWALVLLGCSEIGFPLGSSDEGTAAYTEVVACSGAFVANTRHSVADNTLVIDRFWRDGPRKTVVVPIDEVTAIRVSAKASDSEEESCSTVYVSMQQGRRELWADSTTDDLLGQAEGLARAIGRPLTEDAPESAGDVADAESPGEDQSAVPPNEP